MLQITDLNKPDKIEPIQIKKQGMILSDDYCISCGNIATHKVYYKEDGYVRVEKVCFKHVPIL